MSACLMLHGIGPVPPHVGGDEIPYWVAIETFTNLIPLIRETGARLTFDDGNETDATIALPLLEKHGMKASFFIPSDRINRPGYLSENQIRAMHKAGMEIGSHGCAHVHWTRENDADVVLDVARSVERLSVIINAPVRSVAIPFGDCDRRVLAILKNLGIGRVYTSFRGPEADNAWLVRRDCIKADMSWFDIEEVLLRKPDMTEAALDFLRIWKHAGNAVLRRA